MDFLKLKMSVLDISILEIPHLEISKSKPTTGWSAQLSTEILVIQAKASTNITLTVHSPSNITFGNELKINVSFIATNVNLNQNITLITIIPAVDLIITKVELDDSSAIYQLR